MYNKISINYRVKTMCKKKGNKRKQKRIQKTGAARRKDPLGFMSGSTNRGGRRY